MRSGRKCAFFIILLALTICFSACDGGDKDMNGEDKNEFVMKAEIISVEEKLLVNVLEAEYAFGEYLIIIPPEISIKDESGADLSRTDLKEREILNIVYNGQVMMSYPPQVVARAITLVSD